MPADRCLANLLKPNREPQFCIKFHPSSGSPPNESSVRCRDRGTRIHRGRSDCNCRRLVVWRARSFRGLNCVCEGLVWDSAFVSCGVFNPVSLSEPNHCGQSVGPLRIARLSVAPPPISASLLGIARAPTMAAGHNRALWWNYGFFSDTDERGR